MEQHDLSSTARRSGRLPAWLAAAMLAATLPAATVAGDAPRQLPEFTRDTPADWFNSPPLTRAHLRGKVVLLDVWTFGCWNCYRYWPAFYLVDKGGRIRHVLVGETHAGDARAEAIETALRALLREPGTE